MRARPPLGRAGLAAFTLILGVGAWVRPLEAGPVVVLKSRSIEPYESTAAAFRAAHRDSIVELSLDHGDSSTVVRRMAASNPEAVVTIGLRASVLVRNRLPRTPTVFCVVPNHERYLLRTQWSTGVANDVPPGHELRALRMVAPQAKSVGLLFGATRPASALRAARAAAATAGLDLVEAPLGATASLPETARDLAQRVDVLWIPPDPALATPEAFRFLLDLTIARQKGLLVFSESLVRAGALVAVSPDYAWVGRRVEDAVRRIQAGERPADIPVTPLLRTRIVMNQSTARAIGLPTPVAASTEVEVIP